MGKGKPDMGFRSTPGFITGFDCILGINSHIKLRLRLNEDRIKATSFPGFFPFLKLGGAGNEVANQC